MKKIFCILMLFLIPLSSYSAEVKRAETCPRVYLKIETPSVARFLLTRSDGKRLGSLKPVTDNNKPFLEFAESYFDDQETPDGLPSPYFVRGSTGWMDGGGLFFDLEVVFIKDHFPPKPKKPYGTMKGIFIKRPRPHDPSSYDSLVLLAGRSREYRVTPGTEGSLREIFIKGKKGDKLKFKIKMDSCENDDAKRLVVEKVD